MKQKCQSKIGVSDYTRRQRWDLLICTSVERTKRLLNHFAKKSKNAHEKDSVLLCIHCKRGSNFVSLIGNQANFIEPNGCMCDALVF